MSGHTTYTHDRDHHPDGRPAQPALPRRHGAAAVPARAARVVSEEPSSRPIAPACSSTQDLDVVDAHVPEDGRRRRRATTRSASRRSSSRPRRTRRGGDLADRVWQVINTAFRTHPFGTVRAAELQRWVKSGEYDEILDGDYPRRGDPGATAAATTTSTPRATTATRRARRCRRSATCSLARATRSTTRSRRRTREGTDRRRGRARARPRLEAQARRSNHRAPRCTGQPGHRRARALCGGRRRRTSTRLVELARTETRRPRVVGPEAPLAAGLVDALRARGIPIFGPTRAAAASRRRSDSRRSSWSTPAFPPRARRITRTSTSARRAVAELGAPVVIKATGLAAGKGVVVCETVDEAHAAIDDMLVTARSATPGARSSSRSSWRARSSRSSRSPTASAFVRCSRRRITSDCSPATRPEHGRHGRVRARAPSARRPSSGDATTAIIEPTLARDARARRAVHRAAVRRTDADARRPEGRRVQLPVRRSGDAGDSAADARARCSTDVMAVASGDGLAERRAVRLARGVRSHHGARRARLSRRARAPAIAITLPGARRRRDRVSRRHQPRRRRRARDRRRTRARRDRRRADVRRGAARERRSTPPRSSSPASSTAPTSAGASRRVVPELPETETIARDLDRAISGSTITDVRVTRERRAARGRLRVELAPPRRRDASSTRAGGARSSSCSICRRAIASSYSHGSPARC